MGKININSSINLKGSISLNYTPSLTNGILASPVYYWKSLERTIPGLGTLPGTDDSIDTGHTVIDNLKQ